MLNFNSVTFNGQVTWVRCFCYMENLSKHIDLQEFCQGRLNTPTYAKKAVVLKEADAVAE